MRRELLRLQKTLFFEATSSSRGGIYYKCFFTFRSLLSHRKCAVLGCLHDFTLPLAFVVDSAKMQYAVDNHAVQFLFIRGTDHLCIAAYCVEADENVAVDGIILAVVKCDDVCVEVVLKIFVVDLQYLCVVAEYVGNFAALLAV